MSGGFPPKKRRGSETSSLAALNYSQLEVQDLAVSFNYLAATGAQVGMSLEETATTIAVLTNAGIRASTIGTGLREIIGKLVAPTKEFRQGFL